MPLQSLIDAVRSPIDAAVRPWWTSASSPLLLTFQMTDPGAPGSADLRAESGYSSFFVFNETQKAALRSVLSEISQIINVNFLEVTGVADPDFNLGRVNFSTPGQGGEGGFWYSYNTDQNGNPTHKVWDGYALWDNDWVFGSQGGRNLLLHEMGHALGLKHPGDYDVTGGSTPGPFLPPEYENNKYTVMSYTSNPDNGFRSDHYMPFDILALQQMWGANMTYRSGADVYTGPRDGRIDTIWDAGGWDAIDGSAQMGSVSIDLNEGAFSSLGATNNLAIAYGAIIEDARGSAYGDRLVGNSSANRLSGADGNDSIFGGDGGDVLSGDRDGDYLNGGDGGDILVGSEGYDALEGGSGDDLLIGGSEADWVDGGDGFDFASYDGAAGGVVARLDFGIGSAGDAFGDTLLNIEGLIGSNFADIFVGNEIANQIIGNGGQDTMVGLGGNDLLIGGVGYDSLLGGTGSDVLLGGTDGDTFIFAASENVSGAFDTVADFQDGIDAVVLAGWDPAELAIVQNGADAIITTLDSGYTTGVIVSNATVLQISDQLWLI